MFALLWPMAAFALAASISPGPVNLVGLSSGSRYRLSVGLVFVTGATLGFILLFVSVGLGLYALLSRWPLFIVALRWGGIGYLLFLAWQLARDEGRLGDADPDQAPSFFTGALMQWLNPKAWLATLAGLSALTDGSVNQLLWFAALYLPICWLSLASWVLAGAFLRRLVHNPKVLVTINRTLALLLVLSCAVMIVD
ncbi:LysE family translocator [Saccharospirillum sp. HFRX-1]|uniref:LysE family translocator n=1 Tax=unclassified Saccharospirillum TaxID=2633430 RepID=UPI0037184734